MGLINGHARLLTLIECKPTENHVSSIIIIIIFIIITALCLQWLLDEAFSQAYFSAFVCPQPPRSCIEYWSEFKHCKSLRNRFQHYYAHGTSPSCQQWKEDYDMCATWEKCQDQGAKVKLSASIISRLWVMGSVYLEYHNKILMQFCPCLSFTGGTTEQWKEQVGRAEEVYSSLGTKKCPSQGLAYASQPWKATWFLIMYFHYCGRYSSMYLHYNIYKVWLPPPRVTLWAMWMFEIFNKFHIK